MCIRDSNTTERKSQASFDPCATNLRWSHANVDLYYQHTLVLLQLVLHDFILHENHYLREESATERLDKWYNEVVSALQISAYLFIPKRKKNFLKVLVECRAGWEELKENAIKSCRAWHEAGKPRYGPLNDNYRKDKSCLLYTSPSPRDS